MEIGSMDSMIGMMGMQSEARGRPGQMLRRCHPSLWMSWTLTATVV